MNDEFVNLDQVKLKNKRKKPQGSLSIPNPADLLKRKKLNRPPSVPLLSRRLSAEPGVPPAEEQISRNHSKSSLKCFRRNSVPEHHEKKSEKPHKKTESKVKILQKPLASKPPLHKKLKKNSKPESKKATNREGSLSAPHLRKVKKNVIRLDIPAEIISLTEDKRKLEVFTPNKAIKKIVDLKKAKNKELKKIQKELVLRTVDHTKMMKIEKRAGGCGNENKGGAVGNKAVKKCKTPAVRSDYSPERVLKKKMENFERGENGVKGKNEPASHPPELKVSKKNKERKNTPIKDFEKVHKKPAKCHQKKKSKKIKSHGQWLEQSFSAKPDLKLQDSFCIDQEDLSQYFTSLAPSTNCNFQSPPVEQNPTKRSSSPSINCIIIDKPKPRDSPQKRSKIIKKPFALSEENSKIRQKLVREKAVLKIQALVKGFLARRKVNLLRCIKRSEGNGNNTLIFDAGSEELSEEVDFKQIIDEMQHPTFLSFEENGSPVNFLKDANDHSINQVSNPSESIDRPKIPNNVKFTSISLNELGRRLKAEQKTLEEVEKSFKEIESLEYLDTLMHKKNSIDDLRKRDLAAIHSITSKANSECEIYEIFQNIINRRYEKISSMFDENIRAVKEALANTVLTDDSILKNEENLLSFIQNSEDFKDTSFNDKKCNKVQNNELKNGSISTSCNSVKYHSKEQSFNKVSESLDFEYKRPISPEGLEESCKFPLAPDSMLPLLYDPEPFALLVLEDCEKKSAEIIWIDEVAMPGNIDFTELIVDAVFNELCEDAYSCIVAGLFVVSPELLVSLSEELIQAILCHDIQEQLCALRSQYSVENVFAIIQKIFSKTQGLIISELLKPLEKDPLMALAEIQETEIGSGFLPDEKYSMLNVEAFQDDLYSADSCVRIFNVMVFDCINDCLEKLIVKEDLPWSLIKYKTVKVRTSEQAIQYTADRLLKFSEIRAGQIDQKNEVDEGRTRDLDALKMMVSEIEEEEIEWVKYEKEETQALLDVADLVLEIEIEYIVEVLFNMKLV